MPPESCLVAAAFSAASDRSSGVPALVRLPGHPESLLRAAAISLLFIVPDDRRTETVKGELKQAIALSEQITIAQPHRDAPSGITPHRLSCRPEAELRW